MKVKEVNELVNSVSKNQKKLNIPVLYKMEELESIRENMKKKNKTFTARSETSTVFPAPSPSPSPASASIKEDKAKERSLTLGSARAQAVSSVKKKVKLEDSPRSRTETSNKKKETMILQQKEMDYCSNPSSASKFLKQPHDHSESFRKAFITEIKKVEKLVEVKFHKLEAAKNKEILDLKKYNEISSNKAEKKYEDLKSLVVPMKIQLENQCKRVKELEEVREALEKKSVELQAENLRLEKELSEERGCRDRISIFQTEISNLKEKVDILSSENVTLSNSVEDKTQQLSTLREENQKLLSDAQISHASVDELSNLCSSSEKEFTEEIKRRDHMLDEVKSESKKKIISLEEKVRTLEALLEAKNHHTEATSSKRKSREDPPPKKRRRTKEPPKLEQASISSSALSLVDSFTATLSTSTKKSKQTSSGNLPRPKLNWSVENGKIISPPQSTVNSEVDSRISTQNKKKSRMAELFGDDDEVTETGVNCDQTISTTEEQRPEVLSDSAYSPAKTSKILQPSNFALRIRKLDDLLQENKDSSLKGSCVEKVNFEEKDANEEKPFAVNHLVMVKDAISKDVEKCLTKFLENKSISSKKEFRSLADMLSNHFAERIKEMHLITNESTKDISLSNIEKREFIDQTILFFNIKLWVTKFLQPLEGGLKPDVLNNIKADFTQKFFFQISDTKLALAKENRRDTLTEDYQRHMKDYLDFYINTKGFAK